MTRLYRCFMFVRYNDSGHHWDQRIEQVYDCENARIAARRFIELLKNNYGIREAETKNIEVVVVSTGEKVDKGLLE